MTTALLVLVHGSPREESNNDVRRVLERVRATHRYDLVQPAFLDCNEPDIPTGVDLLVAAGAHQIICVPYFLHLGRHVTLDVPEILTQCEQRHPHVEIRLSPLIGRSPIISELLLQRALSAATKL